MISIRASSLDDYADCQRRFAAKWLIEAEEHLSYGLRRTRPVIGAIVGTAVHSGVAHLLRELARTGSKGGALRVRQAKQAAAEEIHALPPEPTTFDGTTKTMGDAMTTSGRMIEHYHDKVDHKAEPFIVEKGLSLKHETVAGLPYRLTGTLDSYLFDGTLEDLKTGVRKPKPFAQIGTYSLLLRANGFDVKKGQVRYMKRVGKTAVQPPPELVDMPQTACENHALTASQSAAGSLVRLMETGDPSDFLANPKSYLCGSTYCPAHGTSFCPYGAT